MRLINSNNAKLARFTFRQIISYITILTNTELIFYSPLILILIRLSSFKNAFYL